MWLIGPAAAGSHVLRRRVVVSSVVVLRKLLVRGRVPLLVLSDGGACGCAAHQIGVDRVFKLANGLVSIPDVPYAATLAIIISMLALVAPPDAHEIEAAPLLLHLHPLLLAALVARAAFEVHATRPALVVRAVKRPGRFNFALSTTRLRHAGLLAVLV